MPSSFGLFKKCHLASEIIKDEAGKTGPLMMSVL